MVLTCCGASVDEIVTDYARCGLNWKSLDPHHMLWRDTFLDQRGSPVVWVHEEVGGIAQVGRCGRCGAGWHGEGGAEGAGRGSVLPSAPAGAAGHPGAPQVQPPLLSDGPL